jgi:hypothetical protein
VIPFRVDLRPGVPIFEQIAYAAKRAIDFESFFIPMSRKKNAQPHGVRCVSISALVESTSKCLLVAESLLYRETRCQLSVAIQNLGNSPSWYNPSHSRIFTDKKTIRMYLICLVAYARRDYA